MSDSTFRNPRARYDDEVTQPAVQILPGGLSALVDRFVHQAPFDTSVRDLYAEACNLLMESGRFRVVWTGRHNPKQNHLRVIAMAGQAWEGSAPTLSPTPDGQAWCHVVHTGQPVVDITAATVDADELATQFGFVAPCYFPIATRSRVRGVLCVVPRDGTLSGEEQGLILRLCRSIATHGERLLAERTMAAEKGLLRAVLESASYGLYYVNPDGDVLLCNEAYLTLTGRPRSQIVGSSYSAVTAPEHLALEMEAVTALTHSGSPLEYVKHILRPNGFRIPVRVSLSPVIDTSGTSHGTLALVRDTVAEVETARALRQSEGRHRAVFIHHPDAIFVLNHAGTILDANPAAISLTDFPVAKLAQTNVRELVASDSLEALETTLRKLRAGTNTQVDDFYILDANKQIIVTELHGTQLDHETVQLLVRDIRARRDAERRLRELNDQLEDQVAARTRELVQLNENLRRANKMKDAFLANMSHELRTPLNSLLGLGEALLDGAFGELDEQKTQILETMGDSGRHLLDMINEILDLSKLEAGRMDLELRPFSVPEVCQSCLRVIRPLALRKRIQHSVRIKAGFNVALADERRVRQMLVNLLSNAVKFTPDGGSISLEASDDAQHVFFSVTDTGIGISALDQRKIFEPFTQVDSSLSRQHEGTGLGLALARRLAELHDGTITVVSTPGKGSRFTVVLPNRRLE